MEGTIEKLAAISAGVVMLAAATGQLPRFIQRVRLAQLELLKESQASKWGDPILLKTVHPFDLAHKIKSP